jgi:cytochrome c peroxidase
MELFFGRALCSGCHSGFNFTDEIPANTGVGQRRPHPDRGRVEVSGYEWETGFFKPPSLREVEHTAPYMHDGSVKTLEAAVEHYNQGGGKNPYLDERLRPLHLPKQEKRDLVAFLQALSGEGWQHVRPPADFAR